MYTFELTNKFYEISFEDSMEDEIAYIELIDAVQKQYDEVLISKKYSYDN